MVMNGMRPDPSPFLGKTKRPEQMPEETPRQRAVST